MNPKLANVAWIQVGTKQQIYPYIMIAPDKDSKKFSVYDLMLSLCMQFKIRLEKLGPSKQNIHSALQTVADRSDLILENRDQAEKFGRPSYVCTYFMDVGRVMAADMVMGRKEELQRIGPIKMPQEQKTAKIAKGLKKLATG